MLASSLMILVLAGMCAAKTAIQGRIGKALLPTVGSVLFFNSIYFGVSMLCMLSMVLFTGSGISTPTVVYGCLFGLNSVLFQFASTSAMRYGPVSLTVLIVNLSCAIPILVGIAVWKEKPSPWFFPGLALMLTALILSADLKDVRIPHPKRWVIFVAMAFLSNGVLTVIQKLHQFTPVNQERSAFVMVAYLVAALVAFAGALLLSRDRSVLRPLVKPNVLVRSAAVGVLLCVYQQLCLVMAHRMPGSVMYPMLSGMTLVACTLVGIVCFRDPLSNKQKLCVVCGIGAVVFLGL